MWQYIIYLLACLMISLGIGTGSYSYLSPLQCLARSRCSTNCICLYEDFFFFVLHNAYKDLEENYGTI